MMLLKKKRWNKERLSFGLVLSFFYNGMAGRSWATGEMFAAIM